MKHTLIAIALGLLSAGVSAQPTTLTAEDRSAIQQLVTDYARALGSCDADGFADLFVPETGYFASGFRGQIVGHEHLVALVRSERQCNRPAGSAPAPRPGGSGGPTAVVEADATGVHGVADLGAAGQYQDTYVKTPKGWRFASRDVLIPPEKAAGLSAADMLAIRRLTGSEVGDYYAVDSSGAKVFRTAGVAINVKDGAITGRGYLADGSYYDDVYEKTPAGKWQIKSRVHVPAAAH
jgi:hypothetical protein